MAEKKPLAAMKVAGQLCISPTTSPPVDAFPHGGTSLGMVKDVVLRRTERRFNELGEERGGEVTDSLPMGVEYLMAFALRGWDPDAIPAVDPSAVVGATSRQAKIQHPGASVREGVSQSHVSLLFSPENKDHPAVYFRSAIPMVAEELELELGRSTEALMEVVFRAMVDDTTELGSVQVGLLEDIVL